MPGSKKRGRPRKVYTQDENKDAHFRRSHYAWDFTDYVVCNQADIAPFPDAEVSDAAEKRLLWWKSLEYNTLHIAHEICPETGRPHGQGRIRLKRRYRFDALKKIFPADVHFEPSVCTVDDNYLRKWGSQTIVEEDHRRPGVRNIFAAQTQLIKDGATIRDCMALEGANYQSVRSAELQMKYIEPERPVELRDVVFGDICDVPSGVYQLVDPTSWQGYDAHKEIHINQRVLNFSTAKLLQLCGPHPTRVGNQGRQARYDRVYISGIDPVQRARMIGR